jgi:hypothetical protein
MPRPSLTSSLSLQKTPLERSSNACHLFLRISRRGGEGAHRLAGPNAVAIGRGIGTAVSSPHNYKPLSSLLSISIRSIIPMIIGGRGQTPETDIRLRVIIAC